MESVTSTCPANRRGPIFTLCLLVLVQLLTPTANTRAQAEPTSPQDGKAVASIPIQLAPWTGDFDAMRQRRFIRALVANSKTQYYVVNGVQRGSSYEYLKALEEWINVKYPQKVKHASVNIVIMPVSRDQMLSRLAAGTGDIAVGNLEITPERSTMFDFSKPLATGVKEIAVTGPRSPILHSIDDLSGQEVFVRRSSSYWERLTVLNARFRSEGKAPIKLRQAPEDLEDEDLLEMLNAGLVPIVIAKAYLPNLLATIYTGLRPNPDVALDESGQIAWAMRKNSPQLKAVIDQFVKTHKKGTFFGNSEIARYALSPEMLRNAIAPEQLRKFQDTVALFQKYGSQYNVDYLLMMAQGFQESTLNQDAKSRVGAVGIMQLMPATGAQMKVGDIHSKEANIHAGVKYIRSMIDNNFTNEPMDETNKLLFAFAAYNAGPGRIHSLREQSAKQGLNPNIWIDNVELVAAAKIGTETVAYVSNIYKYYIAYKLITEQEGEKKATEESIAGRH